MGGDDFVGRRLPSLRAPRASRVPPAPSPLRPREKTKDAADFFSAEIRHCFVAQPPAKFLLFDFFQNPRGDTPETLPPRSSRRVPNGDPQECAGRPHARAGMRQPPPL